MGDKLLRTLRTYCLALSFLTIPAIPSYATHVFGIDLYYTHVIENTYKVYVVIYGDCAGAAFPQLQNATPQVKIYEDPNTNAVATLSLAEEPPIAGVEVTPVCPSQINNTTCTNVNNTIPGIKKFVYSATYTLPHTSANWRFHFTGSMGNVANAGRSSTITNIVNPGSTVIALDAKLNDQYSANNSSIFGTIPTPFYCLNAPANYAPGSVDPDLDSLYFVQIPGKDANGFPVVVPNVTYIPPYTATAPLAANPFVFVPTTGQMSFTPNLVQRSLAVMEVQEYRGDTLVGTSQREMTIVVLNTCNNWPPSGVISNNSAGTLLDSTTLRVCKDVGPFTFNINPTDPNNDTIDVTPVGLPAGATMTITNNHTLAPHCTFSWNTTNVAPGTYTFYMDYGDNECPLNAYQQIAYQVIVASLPGNTVTMVSPATCFKKAVFTVNPGAGVTNWTETVLQNANTIHTNTNLNGTLTDSLTAGTYTIHVTNDVGCSKDTVITIAPPNTPGMSVVMSPPTCPGSSDGSITINGNGGAPPYTYAIGNNAFGAANTFTGLAAGTYALHIKDNSSCQHDTTVTLPDGLPILLNIGTKRPLCNGVPNGQVTITAYNNPYTPYTYAMNAGPFGPGGTFSNLAAGTYTFHVHNATGCSVDTVITLTDSAVLGGTVAVSQVVCNGDSDGAIIAQGIGGVTPYTYAMDANPYVLNNTFNNLPAGTYSIHIRDVNSCAYDTAVNIQQPTPIRDSSVVSNIMCNGAASGSITINVSGGTPTYTYAIGAGPFGPTNTFPGLTAGTYTIHIQDAYSCMKDTVITLTQPTPVVVSPAVTNVLCYGASTGSITITASGGTPGYTYANGLAAYGPGNTFTNLAAGTYTIHTKDNNGCVKDTVLTITQPSPVTVNAAVTKPLCYGDITGSITINAAGGTPSYTYANGANPYGPTNSFSPLAAGTYTIHTKDANSCIKDTTITISQPSPLVVAPTVSNVLCNGGTGGITMAATGGTPGYVYANGANPYGTQNIFTPLAAGTYTIHTKDTNSCQKDTVVTITQPTPLAVTASTSPILCNGSTGSITITGSGGTPGYTYANGANAYGPTGTFTGLVAGTYTIHTKDANGCIKDTVITLTQPTPLVTAPTVTNVLCNGDPTGSINIAASGGTPAYTYANGANAYGPGNNFTGLTAGTYTIHTKDANSCIKNDTLTITQPSPITVTPTVTNVLCNGGTGGITVAAAGGVPAYTYANGANPYGNTNIFNPLVAGTYTIHTKDANGCIKDVTATITQPTPLNVTPTVSNVLCYGGTGSVTIAATGGTPGYTYANGAAPYGASNTFGGLAAGTYTIHTKDANSCIKDTAITITQPTPLAVSGSANNVLCYGDANGSITVNGAGGTPTYTYANGAGPYAAANTFNGLVAGTYVIHTKDANNCVKDTTITITQPTPIVVSPSVKNSVCATLANGQVTLNASGGTPGYTYANGAGPYAANNTFTALAAGTYVFHTKDTHGCIKDVTVTITDSLHPAGIINTTNELCYGQSTGSINVTGTGATAPYTYALGNNAYANNNTFNQLAAGTYVVHIKDANGCIKDTNATITQPTPISSTVTYTEPSCYGYNDGSLSVIANGGTPAYIYSINTQPMGNTTTYTGLTAGTDTVHVKDNNGCLYDTLVTITQPTKLVIDSIVVTNEKCFGDNNGTVTVYASGGTPSYEYAMDANAFQSAPGFSSLPVGTYAIHVTDSHNCVADSSTSIQQPSPLVFNGLGITEPTCEGYTDGSVSLGATGGTPPYMYAIQDQAFAFTSSYTGLPEGMYLFHVQDSNGCKHDTAMTLVGFPHITITDATATPVLCYGGTDGTITVNANGGTRPFLYQVDGNPNPATANNLFTGMAAGLHIVTVVDSNNCRKSGSVDIKQPDSLNIVFTVTSNDCYGTADKGVIAAEVTGGTSPYTYTWSNDLSGQNMSQITGLGNGAYRLTIHDSNNCTKFADTEMTSGECCMPYIPNAFTPNGDGKNDIFRPVFKGNMKLIMFQVFNRFGELVYETDQLGKGWDGYYKGQLSDMDTYFFHIKFICGQDGKEQYIKGDVTLIR
ncbi:MAG: gliding motility-associated C-terminal domain-containing protein [Bacteroidetes bacterium]|nr:gliding motility-associated C-terminal domain-containing protein [Bacteroidota bacterium]